MIKFDGSGLNRSSTASDAKGTLLLSTLSGDEIRGTITSGSWDANDNYELSGSVDSITTPSCLTTAVTSIPFDTSGKVGTNVTISLGGNEFGVFNGNVAVVKKK